MTETRPRDDILVSVCLVDGQIGPGDAARLRELVARVGARFRYWEMLAWVEPGDAGAHEAILRNTPNLRLLTLRPGTSYYRKRAALAAEAIGDVVLLTSLDEVPAIDPVAMIEAAESGDAIVFGQRRQASLLNPLVEAMGRNAGFRVNGRSMQSAAYPRTQLNALLAHPDRQLALRFPPADDSIAVRWQDVDTAGLRFGSGPRLDRRIKLLNRLLISSAPRVLAMVSISALMVVVLSVVFALYALVVWLTFEQVQPGWFSTSIVLSMTSGILGATIFGLSIGLQHLIEIASGQGGDDVVGERSSLDLYGQVIHELNIETHSGTAPLPARPHG